MSIENLNFSAENRFPLIRIYSVVLFFVMFPYIQFVPTGSDTQPYALLFALLFCLTNSRIILERGHICLFIALFPAFGIMLGEPSVAAVRGFYGYLSICILFIVGYNGYIIYGAPSYLFLRNCLFALIGVGLLQLFVNPNISSFITSRGFGYGGRGGRGVESLTSEPTFLGFLCLLFLLFPILFDKYSRKEKRNLVALCLFLLLFVSRSSSGILTLAVTGSFASLLLFISYLIRIKAKLNLRMTLMVVGLLLGAFAYIGTSISNGSNLRLIQLVIKLISSPMLVITSDPSLNDRVTHIYVSLGSLSESYGMPHGFVSWNDYLFETAGKLDFVFNVGGADGRVMSFFGSGAYELGFFSIPLYFVLLYPIIRERREIRDIATFVGMIFLLLQSVPTGLPTAPFVLGMIAARSRNSNIKGLK